jgi:outer membrane protein OmpA-like peptidoglycan-associated protein
VTNADDSGTRAEQLIGLADRLANETVPPPPSRRWIPIVAGLLALGGGAVAVKYGLDKSDSSTSAPASVAKSSLPSQDASSVNAPGLTTSPSTAETKVASVAETTTQPQATTTVAAPTTTAAAPTTTVAAPTTTVAAPTQPQSSDAANPVRWAEFTGGKVYLRGKVPDRATADEIITKAAAVLGAGNVVDEYEIVAGAQRPLSAPLYIRDSVLFTPGSTEISPGAAAVLDVGIALMKQNPKVTTEIQGHTDDSGSDEANQALSELRVQAIYNYVVIKGIEPERLTKIGYGETRPIADNSTPEGQALNRRVEFTINNLLS